MKDSPLIRKFCSDGDGNAAVDLLGKYQRALYQFIWQMLHHSQDCEDAMQETFSKVLLALPRYREKNQFKSWLFRIGRNEAVEIIRRRCIVVAEAPGECLGTDRLIDRQPAAREVMKQRVRLQSLDRAITRVRARKLRTELNHLPAS